MGIAEIKDMVAGLKEGKPDLFIYNIKRTIKESSASTLEDLENDYKKELERIITAIIPLLAEEGIKSSYKFESGRMLMNLDMANGLSYRISIRLRGIAESALEEARHIIESETKDGTDKIFIAVGVSFSGLDRTIDRWIYERIEP